MDAQPNDFRRSLAARAATAAPLPRAAAQTRPVPTRLRGLEPYRRCAVCGETELRELISAAQISRELDFREALFRSLAPAGTPDYMLEDQAFATQHHPARILECAHCGTLGRDPHLTERSVVDAYEADRYHRDWLETSFDEFRDAFAERMPALVHWVGADARIAEVGSFVGGFLAAAQSAGWSAVGVDVGRCVSDFARTKGLDVRTGALTDMGFADASFDAVFVWCCFEQLPDPERELHEVERILGGGGRLLLRVPNAGFVRSAHALLRNAGRRAERSVLRALAFSGLAGFPFQIGYSAAVLRGLLEDAGFHGVGVRNRINLRGASSRRNSPWAIPDKSRVLRNIHAASELAYYASLGQIVCGPWIEATCSKGQRAVRSRTPHRFEPKPALLPRLGGLPRFAF